MATAEKFRIELSAGAKTDELIDFIFQHLSDEDIDSIDVEKRLSPPDTVAFEPMSAAAILALTVAVSYPVFKLVEQWIENQRQRHLIGVIVKAAQDGTPLEVMKSLGQLGERHAEVTIARGSIPVLEISKLGGSGLLDS